MAYMQEGIDDVVFLNLEYPGKVIANIHVSWLDPQKVRKMIIVGSRKMVVYDDIAENKLLIYDKGIDRRAILGENMDFDNPEGPQFDYRSGDILMPEVKFAEPVRVEAEHFLDCIRNSQEPLTGLAHERTGQEDQELSAGNHRQAVQSADPGARRKHGQDRRLVRQRVGLLQPPR